MTETIIKKSNATLKVFDLDIIFGIKNPWRPLNVGIMEHLKLPFINNNSIDFIMDSQDATISIATESLYPHSKDDWVAVLPTVRLKTQYTHICEIFLKGLGIMLLFFIFVCPLLWFVLHEIETRIIDQPTNNRLQFIFTKLFDNLRLVLGNCLHILPQNFTEKLFLICLLFCNLIINNYFQSILVSILTVNEFEPQINTLKELSESAVIVKAAPGMLQVMHDYFNQTGQYNLIKNVKPANMTFYYHIFENIFKIPTDAGIISNYDRAEFGVIQRPIFHLVRESFVPMYCSFHVSKGSPYKDMIQDYVTRVIEAGLYDLWKRQTFDVFLQRNLTDIIDGGGFRTICLDKFRGSFYVLFAGFGLSFFVFVFEIICNRLSSKSRKI